MLLTALVAFITAVGLISATYASTIRTVERTRIEYAVGADVRGVLDRRQPDQLDGRPRHRSAGAPRRDQRDSRVSRDRSDRRRPRGQPRRHAGFGDESAGKRQSRWTTHCSVCPPMICWPPSPASRGASVRRCPKVPRRSASRCAAIRATATSNWRPASSTGADRCICDPSAPIPTRPWTARRRRCGRRSAVLEQPLRIAAIILRPQARVVRAPTGTLYINALTAHVGEQAVPVDPFDNALPGFPPPAARVRTGSSSLAAPCSTTGRSSRQPMSGSSCASRPTCRSTRPWIVLRSRPPISASAMSS